MVKKINYRMVPEITAEKMDGDTPREKAINALITRSFIGTKDLPSDECLSEARHILENQLDEAGIKDYLKQQFDPAAQDKHYEEATKAILELMK